MRAILSPDDLKSGDLLDPTWYPVEITDYEEKDAETDGSTNCIFTFSILDGQNKGTTVTKLVNEKPKALGHRSIRPFWEALKIPKRTDGGYEFSTDLFKQSIGRKLMIYIKRGKSNKGNEFNDVTDFKPLT